MLSLKKIHELQENYYSRIIPKPEWPTKQKDHEAILFLLHFHNCESFLEIGTWEGFTGRLVLESGIKRVKAIDIHDKSNVQFSHAVHPLSPEAHIGKYLREAGGEVEFADSSTYIPKEKFDAVLIDANHDYEHCRSDTFLALRMAKKIILWHDYGHNGGNDGVDEWLDEFRECNSVLCNFKVYPGSVVAYLEVA